MPAQGYKPVKNATFFNVIPVRLNKNNYFSLAILQKN